MDPFTMVVAIVFITAVASIVRAKMGIRRDRHGNDIAVPRRDPDADRLREELRTLKERVAVLERIATDKAHRLETEIEALRDER